MEKRGFTLLELSIVLVIMGLIIGGILSGRDLIAAAELRATVTQKEKFDTAARTFKLKYGFLPGDIKPAIAANLGFFRITGTYTKDNFGNDIIDQSFGGNMPIEYYVFWRHLSEANLIAGSYGMDATNPISATYGDMTNSDASYYSLFMPEMVSSKGSFWGITRAFRISTVDGSYQTPYYNVYLFISANSASMSPAAAQALDQKVDDGKPNTGIMVDTAASSDTYWSNTPTDGYCTYGGTTNYSADNLYNINPATGGNNVVCLIQLKTGF